MIGSKTALPKNVKEYIAAFAPPVKTRLEKFRQAICETAPQAEEMISYGMPGYKLQGMLVYFAGYKNHIGFYPASAVARALKEAIAFKAGKGTLQFPHDKPLPFALIKKIVKLRIKENLEKAAAKKVGRVIAKKSTANKLVAADPVTAWMDKLDPAVRSEIETVRKIIKKSSPRLSERIKWNAPSYHYKEQDILTFGPYKTNKLLLVFHHPVVVKVSSELLEGKYKDRRLVYFTNKAEAKKNQIELSRIITEILKMINKK